MADVARIPRRRGGLCGLLLILLGAWGALIPFIGPYFKFAYSPDKTWAYTSGRLYLSIVPGAAAVLGGLLVLGTRSRAAGMFGGLLAAAGGAWFIAGAGIVDIVLNRTSIKPGAPLAHAGSGIGSAAKWMFLEEVGFFVGVGILIILFGAIAIGRLSMLSARDTAGSDSDYGDLPSSQDQATASPASAGQYPATQYPAASQYPASPRPFPGEEPTQTQDRFPTSTGQFPAASTGQFPASPSGQYPESPSPFGTKSESLFGTKSDSPFGAKSDSPFDSKND
jgi:hypothetical protein